MRAGERFDPPRRNGALEWLLAGAVVLYALQAAYSASLDKALEQTVFFYVPFALLFAVLRDIDWSPRLLRAGFGVLRRAGARCSSRSASSSTRRAQLLLNPKVIASNELEAYFRVNSLFFDPNIYGRFLVLVMLGLAAVLLWERRPRTVGAGGRRARGAVGRPAADAVAVELRRAAGGPVRARGAALPARASRAARARGAAVAGSWSCSRSRRALRLDLGNARVARRRDLRALRADPRRRRAGARPARCWGWGSGSFAERVPARTASARSADAVSASHTIPMTVAAEQGLIGLARLPRAARRRARGGSLRGARAATRTARWSPPGSSRVVVHTWLYAAFLEDPVTWALLAVGAAPGAPRPAQAPVSEIALGARDGRTRSPAPPSAQARAGRARRRGRARALSRRPRRLRPELPQLGPSWRGDERDRERELERVEDGDRARDARQLHALRLALGDRGERARAARRAPLRDRAAARRPARRARARSSSARSRSANPRAGGQEQDEQRRSRGRGAAAHGRVCRRARRRRGSPSCLPGGIRADRARPRRWPRTPPARRRGSTARCPVRRGSRARPARARRRPVAHRTTARVVSRCRARGRGPVADLAVAAAWSTSIRPSVPSEPPAVLADASATPVPGRPPSARARGSVARPRACKATGRGSSAGSPGPGRPATIAGTSRRPRRARDAHGAVVEVGRVRERRPCAARVARLPPCAADARAPRVLEVGRRARLGAGRLRRVPRRCCGARGGTRRSRRAATRERGGSLIVAAYAEEDVIEARVANVLALDWPRERLQVVVAVDGGAEPGADATAPRARAAGADLVLELPRERQGARAGRRGGGHAATSSRSPTPTRRGSRARCARWRRRSPIPRSATCAGRCGS